jgi:hypothetical protein
MPARTSALISATLVSVGTNSGMFCRPSRGPTSTISMRSIWLLDVFVIFWRCPLSCVQFAVMCVPTQWPPALGKAQAYVLSCISNVSALPFNTLSGYAIAFTTGTQA